MCQHYMDCGFYTFFDVLKTHLGHAWDIQWNFACWKKVIEYAETFNNITRNARVMLVKRYVYFKI